MIYHLIGFDPAPGHAIHNGPQAFGVQRSAVAMLWEFLFHPVVDIVYEFFAPAIDLGHQHGIPHLGAPLVQLRQRVRRP